MDERLVAEAVDNLVSQFSSSLDFYRELVQNSIDAGATAVTVWLEWAPGASDQEGSIAVHVADDGDGMTEAIIDDQLTQLYSSSKEGDLTKIGKFGIGFVSVFAPNPAAVIVHTGRDGQAWEVCFHPDRSFTKTQIAGPLEGTRVTLVLRGDRPTYDDLVERSRATLLRWCGHAEIDLTFHDRSPIDGNDLGPSPVRAAFEAPGDCAVLVEHEQTSIVMAYSEEPSYGFYNRGLALLVTRAPQDVLEFRTPRYGRIGFLVKSRWLEHTLSRETVMRDENLERTLAMLDRAADGPLHAALVQRLVVLVGSAEWGPVAAAEYTRLLGHLRAEPAALVDADHEQPILRTVDGRAASLASLRDGPGGVVFAASGPTPLTAGVTATGVPVLLAPDAAADDPLRDVVAAYLGRRDAARPLAWLRAKLWEPVDTIALARKRVVDPAASLVAVTRLAPDPTFASLAADAGEILAAAKAGYAAIEIGVIAGAAAHLHMCVIGPELAGTMPVPTGEYRRKWRERPCAVLHHEHPQVRGLCRLYRSHPRHAAYALAKTLLLAEDAYLDLDAALIELASILPIGGKS